MPRARYDSNDPAQNGGHVPTPEEIQQAKENAAGDEARGVNGTINTQTVQFRNKPGGAEESRDEALAQNTNNDAAQRGVRQGEQFLHGQSGLDRGPMANEDPRLANNFASGANGNQAGAIELARRQAMGQGISQGAMQLQSGLNQASAQQTSMAAGARGGAAMATASANAMANRSNLQQNAFTGAGMLKSQDMAAGRGMYGTLVDQKRQQAGQRLDQANGFGQDNARRNDDYSIATGQAAVGLGAVGNRQNNQDLTGINRSMESINAQDDANQDTQIYTSQRRREAESQYQEDK